MEVLVHAGTFGLPGAPQQGPGGNEQRVDVGWQSHNTAGGEVPNATSPVASTLIDVKCPLLCPLLMVPAWAVEKTFEKTNVVASAETVVSFRSMPSIANGLTLAPKLGAVRNRLLT